MLLPHLVLWGFDKQTLGSVLQTLHLCSHPLPALPNRARGPLIYNPLRAALSPRGLLALLFPVTHWVLALSSTGLRVCPKGREAVLPVFSASVPLPVPGMWFADEWVSRQALP